VKAGMCTGEHTTGPNHTTYRRWSDFDWA